MSVLASTSGIIDQTSSSDIQPILVGRHLVPHDVWCLILESAFLSPPSRSKLNQLFTYTTVTVDDGYDTLVIHAMANVCKFFRTLIGKRGLLNSAINVALPLVFREGPILQQDYAPWSARRLEGFLKALRCRQATTVRLFLNRKVELLYPGEMAKIVKALNKALRQAATIVIHGFDRRNYFPDHNSHNWKFVKRIEENGWRTRGLVSRLGERQVMFFGVETRLPNLRTLVLDQVWFHHPDQSFYCCEALLDLLRRLPRLEVLRMNSVLTGWVKTSQAPIALDHLKTIDYRGDVKVFIEMSRHIVADSLDVSLEFPEDQRLWYMPWPEPPPDLTSPSARIARARLTAMQADKFALLLPMLIHLEELDIQQTTLSPELLSNLDAAPFPSLLHFTLTRCSFGADRLSQVFAQTSSTPGFPSLFLSIIDPEITSGEPDSLVELLKQNVGRLQWRAAGVDVDYSRSVADEVVV